MASTHGGKWCSLVGELQAGHAEVLAFSGSLHAVGRHRDIDSLLFCCIRIGLVTTASIFAGRTAMLHRSLIAAIALASALGVSALDAQAWDDSKYPDLKGQWVRADGARGVGRYDPTKPPGRLQEA